MVPRRTAKTESLEKRPAIPSGHEKNPAVMNKAHWKQLPTFKVVVVVRIGLILQRFNVTTPGIRSYFLAIPLCRVGKVEPDPVQISAGWISNFWRLIDDKRIRFRVKHCDIMFPCEKGFTLDSIIKQISWFIYLRAEFLRTFYNKHWQNVVSSWLICHSRLDLGDKFRNKYKIQWGVNFPKMSDIYNTGFSIVAIEPSLRAKSKKVHIFIFK